MLQVMSKRIIVLILAVFLFVPAYSQPPAGYYNSASGLTGKALQQALHDIIDNHTVKTYDNLWTCFKSTDTTASGKIWDMYSDKPGGTPAYTYTVSTDQCGNYSAEGDCYNREHSFPKSWFNDASPMVSDLFHIYPTDGYVNGKRSNYPYGVVGSATWTSSNGSKLGTCSWPGYSGTVFEPIDEYKGDFARTYFYMATRYYGEDSGWPAVSDMVDGAQPKTWALSMLLDWHRKDPVSAKETKRNEEVYKIQKNRNPFIDDPSFAEKIWGTLNGIENPETDIKIELYPNPSSCLLYVKIADYDCAGSTCTVFNMNGCQEKTETLDEGVSMIDVSGLQPGIYFIVIRCGRALYKDSFVVAGQ